MKFSGFISRITSPYTLVIFVIIILSFIGLSVVDHYGISWDEEAEINRALWTIDLIKENKPFPHELKRAALIFGFASELIFQARELFKRNFIDNDENNIIDHEEKRLPPQFYERTKLKHRLTFLLSLLTYISIAGIVGILAGLEYAWTGPVILALFPRFWGNGFFSPKDIPFAAMFTLGTFLGACLIRLFHKTPKGEIKLGINQITLYTLLYGIMIGLVTGRRIGGCFLLLFVFIAHSLTSFGGGGVLRNIMRFWSLYLLMAIAWMITTTIIYPGSWSNPVGWFIDTLTYFSKHPWNNTVLFEGQHIRAHNLPWYYLPKWLLITIPEVFQVAFLSGLCLIFYKYNRLTSTQRACVILVILQIFFLPVIAIVKGSTMYDGMRHFLFILPGIAAISATALTWGYQKIKKVAVRVFAIGTLLVFIIPIIIDMIDLHPYEYIYFNRVFGGLKSAYRRYETEYWGLSMREGMEWINQHAGDSSLVVSSSPLSSSKPFADFGINVISIEEFSQKDSPYPFYYIAIPRWDFQNKFPECDIAYQVVRQGVPLTIVKKCGNQITNY